MPWPIFETGSRGGGDGTTRRSFFLSPPPRRPVQRTRRNIAGTIQQELEDPFPGPARLPGRGPWYERSRGRGRKLPRPPEVCALGHVTLTACGLGRQFEQMGNNNNHNQHGPAMVAARTRHRLSKPEAHFVSRVGRALVFWKPSITSSLHLQNRRCNDCCHTE